MKKPLGANFKFWLLKIFWLFHCVFCFFMSSQIPNYPSPNMVITKKLM